MAGNSDRYVIRELKEEEVGQVFDMLLEFADYLKASVSNTQDALHRDLFGDTKRCYCLVAECTVDGVYKNQLAGYSLYSPAYNSFTGAILHINDFFVRDKYRRNGVGMLLYQAVAKKAIDLDCQAVDLLVRPSNKKATEFYERIGAVNHTEGVGRHRMRLTRIRMEDLVKTKPFDLANCVSNDL